MGRVTLPAGLAAPLVIEEDRFPLSLEVAVDADRPPATQPPRRVTPNLDGTAEPPGEITVSGGEARAAEARALRTTVNCKVFGGTRAVARGDQPGASVAIPKAVERCSFRIGGKAGFARFTAQRPVANRGDRVEPRLRSRAHRLTARTATAALMARFTRFATREARWSRSRLRASASAAEGPASRSRSASRLS